MNSERVAVVGAGVIGASVAWHLLRQRPDRAVLLIDTHRPVIGATAYSAGILRRHHSLAADVAMAGRSLDFYKGFDAQVGGDCGYDARGFLVLVAPGHTASLHHNQDVVDEAGTPTELLDADQLRKRYPQLSFGDDELAVLEHDGGYGDPLRTAAAFRASFARAGGQILSGVRVDRLDSAGSTWQLHTNVGVLATDEVVLAAGAATVQLAASVGLPLELKSKRIGLAVTDTPTVTDSDVPVCIDDVTGTYFVPRADGSTAVGVRARPESDVLIPAEPLSAAEIGEALERGSRRVPAFADARVIGTQAACDGYTPDGRPLLGPVASRPGLHLACGFSGGGYKIAPAVGEQVAESLTTRTATSMISGYAYDRFDNGRALTSETAYVYL